MPLTDRDHLPRQGPPSPTEPVYNLHTAHLDDNAEGNCVAALMEDKSRGAIDDALYRWRVRSGWFNRKGDNLSAIKE